ncbi:hypothetical protein [Mycolicibacterium mageritense]|nr:hypothetical protein [Mycolicibacterium mageritense]MCC9184979.1 hypothetical protein [Mycolicibacterium mageritense]TXI59594.1 MAG: hypothetical protein E6Q55_21275 [Mycolicibacterium mageritense]BBX33675.1 hypothetical protein MMAGJ_29570 [Mycolicibacterium mageritense]
MFSNRRIFRDPPGELTSAQESTARSAARRAAREARRSLRTARGQYRRYRAGAGAVYLDWPRWHGEYLNEYHGGGGINEGGLQVSTNVPGDAI